MGVGVGVNRIGKGQSTSILAPDPGDPGLNIEIPVPVTLASGSVLTMQPDGTFDFTPGNQFNSLNAGETAIDAFTYTIDDGLGGTDTATVTVTINGVTDTATAQDDTITVSEDGSLNLGPVLANDDANPGGGANSVFLVEGQAITILAPDPGDPGLNIEISVPVTLASGSVVAMRADGTFDFTPDGQFNSLNAGETAIDAFTYTISDGVGGTDTATVTVTVTINGVTDTANAMDDIVTVSEDGSLNLGPVLANDDANPPGGTLSVILVDGQSTSILAPDPDDPGLNIEIPFPVTLASGSAVTMRPDGTFDFMPGASFNGLADGETATDTFTYTISDGVGGTDTATVTITIDGVNDAPVANDDNLLVNEDDVFTGNIVIGSGLLAVDDPDPEGDPVQVVRVNGNAGLVGGQITLASGGLFVIDAGGNALFDPQGAYETLGSGDSIVETVTYTVADDKGATDSATVTLNIAGRNDAPVDGGGNSANLAEGDGLAGFVNVFDVDAGDSFTITEVNGDPSNVDSTIALASGAQLLTEFFGGFNYEQNGAFEQLAEGETATDSFTFTFRDNLGATGSGTFTFTIDGLNDAPVGANDTASTDEATAISGIDVLANDSDVDNGDTLGVAAVAGQAIVASGSAVAVASGALVTLNLDGTLGYDPNGAFEFLSAGESATDSFSYTVEDSLAAVAGATVTVTIDGITDTTGPVDDDFVTNEDTAVSGNLFADNGNGLDGDPGSVGSLTIVAVEGVEASVGQTIAGPLGADLLTVDVDGIFTYDPNGAFEFLAVGETGSASFTYTTEEAVTGERASATATVTVTGENDAPLVDSGEFSGSIVEPLVITSGEDVILLREVIDGDFTGSQSAVVVDGTSIIEGTVVNTNDIDSMSFVVPTGLVVTNVSLEIEFFSADDYEGLATGTGLTPQTINGNQAFGNLIPDGGSIIFPEPGTLDAGTYDLTLRGSFTGSGGTPIGGGGGAVIILPPPGPSDDQLNFTYRYVITAELDDTAGDSGTFFVIDVDGRPGDAITVTVAFDSSTHGAQVGTMSAAVDPTVVVPVVDGMAVTWNYNVADRVAVQSLAEGELLEETYLVTYEDAHGATATATVTGTVVGENDGPVAQDDSATTDEDSTIVIDVAANDSDIDSDDDATTLIYTVVSGPAQGSVVNNGDGTFTFDPGADFQDLEDGESRDATFSYTASDSHGATDTATVTVTVTGINDAPTIEPLADFSGRQEMPGGSSTAVADFDGDGDADILTMDSAGGDVRWFENDGAAVPSFSEHLIANQPDGVSSVFAVDVDSDGDMDVATTNFLANTVLWYENDGTAVPGFTERVIDSEAPSAFWLFAADMDGDGDTDLLTTAIAGDVRWYENDGAPDPGFTRHTVDDLGQPRTVYAADMDGDGDMDFLVASVTDSSVRWYENDGAAVPGFTERLVDDTASGAFSVFAADVDGDGDTDILAASEFDNTVSWYENDGAIDPVFTKRVIDTSVGDARALYAMDMDGDGDLDILASANTDGTILWYENDGEADPGFTKHVVDDAAGTTTVIVAGDLDDDGDLDIVAASPDGGAVRWYANSSDTNAQQELVFSVASDNAIIVADAEGDVTVTLEVAVGTLTLDASALGALSSVSGDGTGMVTLEGSDTAVNAALDGLTYLPEFPVQGVYPIGVTVEDSTGASTSSSIDVTVVGFGSVADLDGSGGFVINGAAAGSALGWSVSSAGDVNGDGFDDLIMGAPRYGAFTGRAYVVFGGTDLGLTGTLDVDDLDGSNGFAIAAPFPSSATGLSVDSAGDFNGDGFDDLIIGVPDTTGGDDDGDVYIVYGQAGGFAPEVQLPLLGDGDTLQIRGNANERLDYFVSSAGDVNGDGFDDVIIGAPFADVDGLNDAGKSYLVYGSGATPTGTLNVSGLDGSNGFAMTSGSEGLTSGLFGVSVSEAGDINNDGYDDFLVGASGERSQGNVGVGGRTYYVFGGPSLSATGLIDINSIGGSVSEPVGGADFGFSVAGAGDVNGDGFDDYISGAPNANGSGAAYLESWNLFGDSFAIPGLNAGDKLGRSVSGAGDINGDGIGDIIVGATQADGTGVAYVIFGQKGSSLTSVDLTALDGRNGFVVNGIDIESWTGQAVSSAGDINGDGFDDVIIGASGGLFEDSRAGETYVIFGNDFSDVVDQLGGAGNDTLSGGTADEILIGAQGDDSIGGGGNDVLKGALGNDTLDGGAGSDTMIGGAGDDVFVFDQASIGSEIQLDRISDFERGEDVIELRGFGPGLDFASLDTNGDGKLDTNDDQIKSGADGPISALTGALTIDLSDGTGTSINLGINGVTHLTEDDITFL